MAAGLVCLVAAYVLSQFFRSFLAVLTPVLGTELGAGPDDLAIASGLWFIAFALMQFAVGSALDRLGPRRTAAALLAVGGGGGALIFALATAPWHLWLAMALIGIGCSPVLMASYFIFARVYPPKVFGALAGLTVGVGSLGIIVGSAPLAWIIGAIGWRATLGALTAITLLVAAGILVLVRDPAPAAEARTEPGTFGDLFAIRALWPVAALMLVAYAPAAVIRGLWAGPYLSGVYGADADGIGLATLVMSLAMVAGNLVIGPLDRLVGSRKWSVVACVSLSALALGALAYAPAAGFWTAAVLLAVHGFFGATYPAIMAHGRSFLPPHLIGRGVSFINMFSIGGAGIMQFASRPVYRAMEGGSAEATFRGLFLFFLVPLIAGLAIYLFSRDERV
ncbi:MFS transporter [Frigidibacter sp. RF13]|uniref:MFS transporter n=1 Tax=Frigidibacter sp. RF13 TaxID=2997340 RepID=UPI002271ACA1|nr:MFS transporter [Frigidibacter sp. RF13]MCY1126557.1 MFS transporter [Frigidibacter sp. RF13]